LPLSSPVLDALFRPRWGGGWALTRLLFGLAALWAHLERLPLLGDALAIGDLRFNAGPLYLAQVPLLPAPLAYGLWAAGLLGLLGLLRGGAWAKPGLLLWFAATAGLIAGVGLNVRVPERFATWAVGVLLLAPIGRTDLLRARVSPFPRLVLLVIMGSLYLSTGFLKGLEEPRWWDGTALSYDLLDRWHAGGPLAVWLSGQPALCAAMSIFTLAFELGFVFLIGLRVTNPLVLVAGALMHLGIASLMDVGSLGNMALSVYPVLLDPDLAERAWGRLSHRLPPRLRAALEAAAAGGPARP
jgi:hypothetical protein